MSAVGKVVSAVSNVIGTVASVLAVIPGPHQPIAAAVAVGAGLVSSLTQPEVPQSATQLGRLQARLDTHAARKIVLGPRTAMPADIRYYEGSGESDEFIDYILVVAAHRVGSIDEIWFEDQKAWAATGGVQGAFAGYLTAVDVRLEGTAANTIAINGGTRWGANCRLTGCAYLRLRIKRTGNSEDEQSPLANGLPGRVTIIGEGMPCYDPRFDSTAGGSGAQRFDDQSTWGASADDPIIQSLNVLIGWRINGELSVGAGLPAKYLDLDSAITGANICDEDIALSTGGTQKRYRTAGAFSTDDAPMAIVGALLAGCAGELLDSEGRLSFLIKTNTLATPAVTFDDHDILSGGQWDAMGGQTNLPNIVSGNFTDPGDNALFQMVPYPSVKLPSEDGIQRTLPLDLGTVDNAARAQRIVKQTLQRKQYPGTFAAEFNMKGMAAKVGRVVWLTRSVRGWVNKPFRVVSQTPSRSGRIALVLREEHASIYAWAAEDSAAVQAAEPVGFDPRNSGPILLARQAGKTAEWPNISDPDGTRPEDNADRFEGSDSDEKLQTIAPDATSGDNAIKDPTFKYNGTFWRGNAVDNEWIAEPVDGMRTRHAYKPAGITEQLTIDNGVGGVNSMPVGSGKVFGSFQAYGNPGQRVRAVLYFYGVSDTGSRVFLGTVSSSQFQFPTVGAFDFNYSGDVPQGSAEYFIRLQVIPNGVGGLTRIGAPRLAFTEMNATIGAIGGANGNLRDSEGNTLQDHHYRNVDLRVFGDPAGRLIGLVNSNFDTIHQIPLEQAGVKALGFLDRAAASLIDETSTRFFAIEADANNTESRTANNTANLGSITQFVAQQGASRGYGAIDEFGLIRSGAFEGQRLPTQVQNSELVPSIALAGNTAKWPLVEGLPSGDNILPDAKELTSNFWDYDTLVERVSNAAISWPTAIAARVPGNAAGNKRIVTKEYIPLEKVEAMFASAWLYSDKGGTTNFYVGLFCYSNDGSGYLGSSGRAFTHPGDSVIRFFKGKFLELIQPGTRFVRGFIACTDIATGFTPHWWLPRISYSEPGANITGENTALNTANLGTLDQTTAQQGAARGFGAIDQFGLLRETALTANVTGAVARANAGLDSSGDLIRDVAIQRLPTAVKNSEVVLVKVGNEFRLNGAGASTAITLGGFGYTGPLDPTRNTGALANKDRVNTADIEDGAINVAGSKVVGLLPTTKAASGLKNSELVPSITAAAQTAEWAQTSGRPTNLPQLDAARATKLDGVAAGADVTTDQPVVSKLDPVTGRGDGRALSANLSYGVRAVVKKPNVLFSPNGLVVDVIVSGGSLDAPWGSSYSLPNATFVNKSPGTTYHLVRNVSNPESAGESYDLITDPALINGTTRVWIMTITTPPQGQSTGGSTGGNTPPEIPGGHTP